MTRTRRIKIGLLTAFAIETLCVTYCLKFKAYLPVFSILYFGAGISIALFTLSLPELTPISFKKPPRIHPLYSFKFAAVCILGAGMYFLSKYWLDCTAIDVNTADMLPIIREMGQRFVNGQWNHVYDPIPSIWNGIKPIYLPAMWLPFVPSILFKFDMRWITVGGLFFAFSSFLFIFYNKKEKGLSFAALMISAILFSWLYLEESSGLITITEEGIVVAYYVLLVLSLPSGNAVAIGIAASLCMLSRYALIGWIPAYLLFLLLNKKGKQAIILTITGISGLLVLCILPFGLAPFLDMAKLPGKYIGFAKIVWTDSPDVYDCGLGFARFFGQQGIRALHATLIVLSFSIPILFVAFCFIIKKKRVFCNIPLAALKISVVVFYNFIDVPYLYLFYCSSFISLLLVASLIRQEAGATFSTLKAVRKSHGI